jgi:hypothetical protein
MAKSSPPPVPPGLNVHPPSPPPFDIERKWLNATSASLGGSGIVLFTILIILNSVVSEITFALIFVILVPFYIVILPLLSLLGSLFDSRNEKELRKSLIRIWISSIVGGLFFVLLLLVATMLTIGEDGLDEVVELLELSVTHLILFILFTNIVSSSIGPIVNKYSMTEETWGHH